MSGGKLTVLLSLTLCIITILSFKITQQNINTQVIDTEDNFDHKFAVVEMYDESKKDISSYYHDYLINENQKVLYNNQKIIDENKKDNGIQTILPVSKCLDFYKYNWFIINGTIETDDYKNCWKSYKKIWKIYYTDKVSHDVKTSISSKIEKNNILKDHLSDYRHSEQTSGQSTYDIVIIYPDQFPQDMLIALTNTLSEYKRNKFYISHAEYSAIFLEKNSFDKNALIISATPLNKAKACASLKNKELKQLCEGFKPIFKYKFPEKGKEKKKDFKTPPIGGNYNVTNDHNDKDFLEAIAKNLYNFRQLFSEKDKLLVKNSSILIDVKNDIKQKAEEYNFKYEGK